VNLTEARRHALSYLCELVGHTKPARGMIRRARWFTFERRRGQTRRRRTVGPTFGRRTFFGWEYKGRHKDLTAAYDQLLEYRADLNTRRCWSCAPWTSSASAPTFNKPPPARHQISLTTLGQPRQLESSTPSSLLRTSSARRHQRSPSPQKASGHFAEHRLRSMRDARPRSASRRALSVRVVFFARLRKKTWACWNVACSPGW